MNGVSTPRGRARQAFLAAVSLLALARGASAHDFWLEPSTYEPTEAESVSLRLRVGEHFRGDPVPRNDAKIERFVVAGPLGEAAVAGRDSADPAGVVKAKGAGPYVVGYRSKTTAISLEAAKFEAYLAEEGLETVIAARKAKNASEEPGREIYSRCAKTLFHVGASMPAGEAPTGFDRALGLRLELVPLADPRALAAGTSLEVELRYEGKALPKALVVAIRKDAPDERVTARTDDRGRVHLAVSAPGVWLVKSVHMVAAPAESKADWESLWASLTFEVAAPPAPAPTKGDAAR